MLMTTIPHWFFMLPVVAINVCANLLLKAGAMEPASPLLLNFLGLMCFGLGGLAYAWLLRYVPLGVAQAVLSSQYIITILGAWLLFHESIDLLQMIGFILIAVGILLVVYR